MMDVFEAIEKRRTVRIFKEKATEEQIKKLLLAGVKAPSSKNKQSWEFILVEDQELINQLAEFKYDMNREVEPAEGQTQEDVEKAARFQQKAFANANVIAVCSNKGTVADGWLAIENILLAATADGLGSGIIALRGEAQSKTEKLLEIPENKELVCVLKFGISDEEPKPKKSRPDFSWLHKNKYSQP
jgi:nitroreductase